MPPYFNPDHGRFTQRDPSGQDLPYAYAANDPVNNADPDGLLVESVGVQACYVTFLCAGLGWSQGEGRGGMYAFFGFGTPGVSYGYQAMPGPFQTGATAVGSCAAGPAGIAVSDDFQTDEQTVGYAAATGTPGCSIGVQLQSG